MIQPCGKTLYGCFNELQLNYLLFFEEFVHFEVPLMQAVLDILENLVVSFFCVFGSCGYQRLQ